MESIPNLTEVAFVLAAATFFGVFSLCCKQPALLGYIFAGMLLGPSGMAIVEDQDSIHFLADLGIILLLFFVGMELCLKSFIGVWRISLITTITQILCSLGIAWLSIHWLSLSLPYALLLGFSLSMSSTAVTVNLLNSYNESKSHIGRITVGILISQDISVIPMILILQNFSSTTGSESFTNYSMFLKIFVTASVVFSSIFFLRDKTGGYNLPFYRLPLHKSDLGPVTALALCFICAACFGFFGLSPALGAFIAGIFVGNSLQGPLIQNNAHALLSILSMIFFLSIGLMINFDFIWSNKGIILLASILTLLFKIVTTSSSLYLQGERLTNLLVTSLSLAQIGEFSFVLMSIVHKDTPFDYYITNILVSVTIFTLIGSSILMSVQKKLRKYHATTSHSH